MRLDQSPHPERPESLILNFYERLYDSLRGKDAQAVVFRGRTQVLAVLVKIFQTLNCSIESSFCFDLEEKERNFVCDH